MKKNYNEKVESNIENRVNKIIVHEKMKNL